jgi:hypothetical protein
MQQTTQGTSFQNAQHMLSRAELVSYFKPEPLPEPLPEVNPVLVTIGALFLLGFICGHSVGAVLIGALFIFLGCKSLIFYRPRPPYHEPSPTDAEYETWVESFRSAIRASGMQQLGLDLNEIQGKILSVRGPIWPDSDEARRYYAHNSPVRLKPGLDGSNHFSVNRFTFFYPTQHYIAVFRGDINALSTFMVQETQTYFYDDIVGIETAMFGTRHGFFIRISSGQSIGTITGINNRDVDDTVQALRILLRDKKYGIRGGGRETKNP